MTVELDNMIKNIKGTTIYLELLNDHGIPTVFLSNDKFKLGDGYPVQSIQDVLDTIRYYLDKNYGGEPVESED